MTKTHQILYTVILGTAAILIGVLFFLNGTRDTLGKAPSGLAARVATTSLFILNAEEPKIIFASSTSPGGVGYCTSRTVTTKTSPVLITFYDGATSSPEFGHLQTASTTVTYDAEVWGCGRWIARTADDLSTILTLTESQ